MKRMLSMLMVVCLLLGVSFPAHAEDLEDGQAPAPVVGALEELQAAINEAEDGDTIAISQSIALNTGILETDKQITLTRADGFSDALLTVNNSCQIIGFDFLETAEGSETVCVNFTGEKAVIKNCTFTGNLSHTSPFLLVYGAWMATNSLSVEDCSFAVNGYSAVEARGQTDIDFTQCNFSENSCLSSQGGAVYSAGVLLMLECVFSNNTATAGGGIYCSGELIISDCQFSGNSVSNENWGKDIFCIGTLSITNELDEAAGYYEMTTGEKIELPLERSTTFTKLAYFSTEEAEEYFRPIESEPEIEPIPEPTTEPTSTPDNDNSSQEPQEPPEDDDDGGNDDTPPKPQKPVQTPSKPNTATSADTPARMLKCGDAVIDTSRSVVLAGYGDGLLHKDDPLTRAQLSTIIYRLLSKETLRKY